MSAQPVGDGMGAMHAMVGVAADHGEQHDALAMAGMALCLAAFVAIGVGALKVAGWFRVGRIGKVGSGRPPSAPGRRPSTHARAGPAALPQLCVWRL